MEVASKTVVAPAPDGDVRAGLVLTYSDAKALPEGRYTVTNVGAFRRFQLDPLLRDVFAAELAALPNVLVGEDVQMTPRLLAALYLGMPDADVALYFLGLYLGNRVQSSNPGATSKLQWVALSFSVIANYTDVAPIEYLSAATQ